LKLNLSNPLYVSSDSPDLLTVHFTNNSYYIRQNDTVGLPGNFTIFEAKVPRQAQSQEVVELVKNIGESA